MKKRLGNFLILCGLICLVLFFTSNAFILDDAVFFFAGISLTSLGLLLKRAARRKARQGKHRDRRGDRTAEDEFYD